MLSSVGWAFDRCPDLKSIGTGVHGPETSPWRRHDDLWSLHLYRYHGVFEWDRGSQEIVPGLLSLIPPGTRFRRHYPSANSVHLFALFSLEEGGGGVRVPWFRMLGPEFAEVNTWLESAVGLFPLSPLRAAMRVWDVVWRFRLGAPEPGGISDQQGDWLVEHFVQWVEQHLSTGCTLPEVTDALGCSYTHLNNHVQRHLGVSVKKYIRTRRLERAKRLLKYTQLSVKEVAVSLGFASLQAFNQFVQREAGMAPRTLRAGLQRQGMVTPSQENG